MAVNQASGRPAPRGAPGLYYGWVIVAAVFCLLALAYVTWYCFGLFLVALVQEFGWARAEVAGAFSLFVLMHAVCSPLAGRLVDRFGSRALVHGGALLLGAALFGCSRVTALWQFYLCFGVLAAAGVTAMGWVAGVALVGRWFSRRLGLAIGIIGAGIGLGTFVGAPPIEFLIDSHGWRATYVVLAVLMAVVPQPLALLLRTPGRGMGVGEWGLGDRDGGRADRKGAPGPQLPSPTPQPPPPDPRIVDAVWARQEWTVGRAVRTRRFQLLLLTFGLSTFATQQTHAHQAAYLVGSGYDAMLTALVVGTVGLASIAGKILLGVASDALGRERVFTAGIGAGVVAMLLLLSFAGGTSPALLLFVYAALFALGYSAAPTLTPAITADLFSGRHYGAIYGVLMLANGVGGATGAWWGGYVYDHTGSYRLVWLGIMVAFVLAGSVIWLVAPRAVRRVPGQARPHLGPLPGGEGEGREERPHPDPLPGGEGMRGLHR
ncbi:MAG TPA: MFS transporter [Chloroflexota bacterium]|nr:MFS transporter [Chloroflexota bacterium]